MVLLFCGVLGSGGRQGGDSAVFESVAGAFKRDDVGVVNDAVDHGRGHDLVAEDIAPAGEWAVARQDQRGMFVAR